MTFKIIGLGEVLWDLLPGGKQLGGAPANFAYHARALGADGSIISRIGKDALGQELLARIEGWGLPSRTIQVDSEAPTGTVSVTLNRSGHPSYVIHENVAWDNISADASLRTFVADAHAICFGTLAQRSEPSRSTIRSLVESTPPDACRIFDINLRQNYYSIEIIRHSLQLANVLKVNDAELPRIAELFGWQGSPREQIAWLAKENHLKAVAYTRGDQGSLLFAGGEWSDHPGIPTQVADTVGAGDSFTAAMAIGLLAGWNLDIINERANRVASCVASSAGATPAIPKALRALFD